MPRVSAKSISRWGVFYCLQTIYRQVAITLEVCLPWVKLLCWAHLNSRIPYCYCNWLRFSSVPIILENFYAFFRRMSLANPLKLLWVPDWEPKVPTTFWFMKPTSFTSCRPSSLWPQMMQNYWSSTFPLLLHMHSFYIPILLY